MTKQTVIVTGGSSGMGKEMATHLALGGWNVVITGRTEETLEKTANEIKQKGGSAAYFQMDVRNPEDADQMVKFAVDTFGDVDALINNAAGNFLVQAEKLSPNGWKAVIDIVLNGTFFCSHAVGNYWIRQKKRGSMINMVATYAWGAGVGVAHSAAAKAGVLSLTRTLAVEWGRQYRIRVNAIAPGPIERTGGADKLWESEEAAQRTLDSVPLGRLGTPEEIAELASFLLSEQASYINGDCITMDGGQWLNQSPF
ncbi:2,4-dienoyl-CoA reductase [Bacillus pumilus]|uniref:2,4-dienoyl-CoA reductase n=1 Tax=Bacillus pumilus TaxID=1408 RepID=A0AAD0HLP2_BACPU|nr:2,4-dienoyl-CoA reductase [Bacillus pumilus]AVM23602.1 2,4-dienoyl-CoA reductase [Bacillus pumilus]TYS27900.1 2,4-dienoyl-CoA reductase [Bacillus pumilus]TYS40419.1 2,4-dienoyl-CoA reductase [Bacillus pumilus]TYS44968.1 2,4-dienoyl-CoA reductase [Bacillus pumilus]